MREQLEEKYREEYEVLKMREQLEEKYREEYLKGVQDTIDVLHNKGLIPEETLADFENYIDYLYNWKDEPCTIRRIQIISYQ